jgi:molecular chaperone GrpE
MSFKKPNKKGLDAETSVDEVLNEEKLEDQQVDDILESDIIIEESKESLEGFVQELKEQNKKIDEENIKLTNEMDALKERMLRLNSEYENFRKRTAKEKEGIYTDACEDVLKNMLPVLDNLERALSIGGSVEDLRKGIEMTVRQFQDGLTKVQVEEIPGEGDFDPNLHNAVMHIEDEQFGANQITEVFQKGYKRGDKVLRHSMVKVAN